MNDKKKYLLQEDIGRKEWLQSLRSTHKCSLELLGNMANKAVKIYGTERDKQVIFHSTTNGNWVIPTHVISFSKDTGHPIVYLYTYIMYELSAHFFRYQRSAQTKGEHITWENVFDCSLLRKQMPLVLSCPSCCFGSFIFYLPLYILELNVLFLHEQRKVR